MNLVGENGERQDFGDDQEWEPGLRMRPPSAAKTNEP
jgi:hypothetical protein